MWQRVGEEHFPPLTTADARPRHNVAVRDRWGGARVRLGVWRGLRENARLRACGGGRRKKKSGTYAMAEKIAVLIIFVVCV